MPADSREPCVTQGTHSKLLKCCWGQEGRLAGLFPDVFHADILLFLLALPYLYFEGSRICSSYELSRMKMKGTQEWNKEVGA